MNHTFRPFFLYRLWNESSIGFVVVCIFIGLYGYFFCKKMDMFLFPYNAMFAGAPSQKKESDFFVLKVNGRIVPVTQHFYWKKDMLEQSVFHYANYQMNGKRVFLNEYIQQKSWPASVKENMNKRLTPGNITFYQWANWYLTKAAFRLQEGDIVSLHRLKPEWQHNEIRFSEMQVIEQFKWKK